MTPLRLVFAPRVPRNAKSADYPAALLARPVPPFNRGVLNCPSNAHAGKTQMGRICNPFTSSHPRWRRASCTGPSS